MKLLLRILHQGRVIIVFFFLEIISLSLMFSHNDYQSAGFAVTLNRFFGNIYQLTSRFSNFVDLDEQNQILQTENAQLRHTINSMKMRYFASDELIYQNYIPAKVVSNTVGQSHNYMILNKGKRHGIKPRMGVITYDGIVGKVKSCSENFSVVFSLLNPKLMVAGRIRNTLQDSIKHKSIGTVRWVNTLDPTVVNLLNFPAYVSINQKDTIVTAGYDGIFPNNHPIGIVHKTRKDQAGGREIEIKLNTNLSAISHVYVVDSPDKTELDSLKSTQIPSNE